MFDSYKADESVVAVVYLRRSAVSCAHLDYLVYWLDISSSVACSAELLVY